MNTPTEFAPLEACQLYKHRIMFAAPDGRPVMAVCHGGHERQFTADEMDEIRRRTVACWNKFGDIPTELIEAIPGTVDGQMMHLEEHIQNVSAAVDLLIIALNTNDAALTKEAIAKARAAQAAAEEGLPR